MTVAAAALVYLAALLAIAGLATGALVPVALGVVLLAAASRVQAIRTARRLDSHRHVLLGIDAMLTHVLEEDDEQ